MMKKWLALLLAVMMVLSFASCGGGAAEEATETDLASMSWDQIEEQAKGTDVAFYGWGGDENRNN